MIKGDKIKLVKPMGVLTNIGEVCEVTNVIDDGIITFRFGNGLHLGCMSYDEFLKYFEMIEEKPKRLWTEWRHGEEVFYDLNNRPVFLRFSYRDNGKKVQVRAGNLKSESTCSKYDTFNIDTGFIIAKKRLIVKYLANQAKEIAKSY